MTSDGDLLIRCAMLLKLFSSFMFLLITLGLIKLMKIAGVMTIIIIIIITQSQLQTRTVIKLDTVPDTKLVLVLENYMHIHTPSLTTDSLL